VFDEYQRLRDARHREREAERARRSGRKPLDAQAIARAGVAIADAQGLEDVSMRKIAALLGSGTMSLYHYVRTKEDLLASMEDIIMGEILVSERALKGGWRKGVTAIASATRDAYRRHPWMLGIQSGGGDPGLNNLRHVEQSLAAMAPTGLRFEDKMSVVIVVDDYVFGHCLRATEAGAMKQASEADFSRISDYITAHVTPAEFPMLTAEIGDSNPADFIKHMASVFEPDEWFEIGLDSLLDGLAKRFNLAA
jgi:AcrR family transcriptional regulator